jgi:hypothetical protein
VRVVVRFLLSMVMLAGLGLGDSIAFAEGTSDPSSPGTGDPTSGPSSSQSSSPDDQPSQPTPSQPTPSQPTPSQPSASSSAPETSPAAPQSRSRVLAAGDEGTTTITNPPPRVIAYGNRDAQPVTFNYRLDKGTADGVTPGSVTFRCWMNGNRKSCPTDTPSSPNETTGSTTLSLGPTYKAYTFTVKAVWTQVPATPRTATQDKYTFRVYSAYRPGSFMPHDGASFNNPVGSRRAGRANLTRMIKTINAMPGYRQGLKGGACPKPGSGFVPGNIRVSLYSMVDTTFAKAMNAASKRCLSVQILMNNHLNRKTDSAWRRMEDALGYKTKSHGTFRRSFAHRCHFACRGGGVLHTKMYLFDSTLPNRAASHNKIQNTTFTGSSNMTSNASYIQWNDLYGDVNNAGLFKIFNDYFNKMRKDNGYHRNGYRGFSYGKYNAVFWPVTKGHDPEMAALRAIRCSGASGGTGISGHTAVYINMHAWFGLRGLAFQRIVRGLYSKGCYVRILYSFMTPRVYSRLKSGTGGRMQLRRTIFGNHPGSHVAGVYSHFKNFLVSGHYGGDSSARVVWTGSNNFTPDGKNFDEVMLRIKSTTVFRQYYRHFNYIKHRKSSATYASFTEPRGGGRAP